jgi:hypothetical protein
MSPLEVPRVVDVVDLVVLCLLTRTARLAELLRSYACYQGVMTRENSCLTFVEGCDTLRVCEIHI